MKSFQLTYKRFSETSILVQWPENISPEILGDILRFKGYLMSVSNKKYIDIINTYCSCLIKFEFYITDFEFEISSLKERYATRTFLKIQQQKLWKIPVSYDASFGLDLDDISNEKELKTSEIIQLHAENIYNIYFIGFLPGFLYLGGLNKQLFMPRKKSPRPQIEKGAVAIGGEQTGIYPNKSPGGWNIIGNSPIEFFNPKAENPCFAAAGDSIKFVPVDLKTHQTILENVLAGNYKIESEVIDG